MVKLEPYRKCPFGMLCDHRLEFFKGLGFIECSGMNPNRDIIFICELWAENYEGESKWDQMTIFN